jgi:hypothetical protein
MVWMIGFGWLAFGRLPHWWTPKAEDEALAKKL